MRPFLQAQAAGVDGRETNFVTWQSHARQNLAHFREAEDDGQLLFRGRTHDAEDGPRAVEGLFVAELNAAEGDGHRVAGVMFDILDEEKVLAQLLLSQQVG